MVEPAQQPKVFSEHWSLFLRCTICLGYLHEPHTLSCGHTFCTRCLKKLAEVTQEENPDVTIRRLKVSCPTCRHSIPAKKILQGKLSTCIILKQMIELWKKETMLLASSTICPLRTICTQTCLDSEPAVLEMNAVYEKNTERPQHLEEYIDLIKQRVAEAKEEIEFDSQEFAYTKCACLWSDVDGGRQRGNLSHDSDSSASSEYESSASLSSASVLDIYSRINLPQITAIDCTPGRFALMIIWCVYSVVIVGLAEAFLSYIILFTLFFFLIVLK
ncbi:tripartite motif-containing protein 61 [Biomphalaria pfeifferi]|uniref:Tripartite motif-containing protein 61 n=1 Tax=Biomphalaria pfeifferi TaxID=112525 RepID=A0AAD8C1Z8_BIOPF|nr:tripartite motif-containing protein 61 [Biomphalaria pfeifferi]